jgi:hypothetical protein
MSHVSVPRLDPAAVSGIMLGHTSGTLTLPFAGCAMPMNSTGPYPCVELLGTTK